MNEDKTVNIINQIKSENNIKSKEYLMAENENNMGIDYELKNVLTNSNVENQNQLDNIDQYFQDNSIKSYTNTNSYDNKDSIVGNDCFKPSSNLKDIKLCNNLENITSETTKNQNINAISTIIKEKSTKDTNYENNSDSSVSDIFMDSEEEERQFQKEYIFYIIVL
jgi:hypothetical protein